MNTRETERLKAIIRTLEIAKKQDYLTYHAIIDNEILNKETIRLLKKVTGWDGKDDEETKKMISKIEEENKGVKEIGEKFANIKEILKVSLFAAIGLAGGVGLIAGGIGLIKTIKNHK